MFGASGFASAFDPAQTLALIAFAALIVTQIVMRERELMADIERAPRLLLGLILGILLALVVMSPGDNHAFIYFQF